MNIDKSVLKKSIDSARPTNLHLYNVSPTDKDSGKTVALQVSKLLSKTQSATVVIIEY